MPEKTMLPADFSDAPISLWRRGLNFAGLGGGDRSRGPGAAAAGSGLRLPDLQGHRLHQLGVPDPDSEAAGRSRRRHGERHRRIGLHSAHCQFHGSSAGHRRRNLSLGIRAWNPLRQPDPLHRGRAQRRAFDHRGHCGLRPGGVDARDISRPWPAALLWPS